MIHTKMSGLLRSLRRSVLLSCAGLMVLAGCAKADSDSPSVQSDTPYGPTSEPPVSIYLFWGEGCPHCAQAKPFL